jgi:hypothetical protein
VVLYDQLGKEVDRLGWGSAQQPEAKAAVIANLDEAYVRVDQSSGKIIDTDNNEQDFIRTGASPNGGGFYEIEDQVEYQPLLVTELLPDPAPPQSDAEHEFIELYNPSDTPVNTEGYILQSGNSYQYSFVLPTYTIVAKGYLVLYASETGLTLANTTSQVRILNPDSLELHKTASYSAIKEGYSWILYEDSWSMTNQPTPGEKNLLVRDTQVTTSSNNSTGFGPCPAGKFRNPATNRCKTLQTDNQLKPCAADQFRNPETNRCKKISSSSSTLTPCSTGQYRNPETNRCKSLATSASSSLKPCNAGQFRNPATNRCKKIESSKSTLKPCEEGQERNPETNRCRKVAGVSTANALTQPASVQNSSVRYGVVIAVAVLAGGYGLYEYRHEILSRIRKVFTSTS